MSYEPTVWKDGDLVTSAKLNKLEQGVANNGILVVQEGENETLDRTWQEIYDAPFAIVIVDNNYDDFGAKMRIPVEQTVYQPNQYDVYIDGDTWTTSTPDGYPALTKSTDPAT